MSLMKSCFVAILLLLPLNIHGDLFSPVNRYQLSDGIRDSMRNAVRDTGTVPFLGQPLLFDPGLSKHCARLVVGEHALALNAGLRTMLETRDRERQFNYYATVRLEYKFRFLSGMIDYDLHSVNTYEHTTLMHSLYDVADEQATTGYNHIGDSKPKDFNFRLGYLQFANQAQSLIIGKYKLRWGPGYKGTLGLSGATISPFYYYYYKLTMGKFAALSCFLNGFDDDFLFPDSTGSTSTVRERYSAGQRIDLRLGRHVQAGLFEIVDFHGTRYLSRFANPLQIYYFGNVAGGTGAGDGEGERNTNILGGFDVQVVFRPWRAYLEFMNDDMTFLTDDNAPNKFAYQIGGVWYPPAFVSEVGAEYTHISYGTYTHRYPGLNRHVYWNDPRGWPWGNDQDLWHLRISSNLPHHLRVSAEADGFIKGNGIMTDYHWDMPDTTLERLDLKHTGNFVDYQSDPSILSFILHVQWKPLWWIEAGVLYRPAFQDGASEHYMKAYTIIEIPGNRTIRLE